VKSESEVVQLCPTPSDPMDCRLPGSSIHGIFQARVLEWVAIALSKNALFFSFFNLLCFYPFPILQEKNLTFLEEWEKDKNKIS